MSEVPLQVRGERWELCGVQQHKLLGGSRMQGSGFRVQGAGFRVQGSGFKVQGSGFIVQS